MENSAAALLAAERPRVRWRVGRRARIFVQDGRLIAKTRFRHRSWKLGPGGVVSAVHVLPGRRGKGIRHHIGMAKQASYGGCLHFCNEAGEGLACMPPSEWQPGGKGPIPLEKPDAAYGISIANSANFRSEDASANYLQKAGIVAFLEGNGVSVASGELPPKAKKWSGTVSPGPTGQMEPLTLLMLLAVPALSVMALMDALPAISSEESMRLLAFYLPPGAVAFSTLFPLLLSSIHYLLNVKCDRSNHVLRPVPAGPVIRSFRSRSSLSMVQGDLIFRDSANVKRVMRGPKDRVMGVQEAVVIYSGAKPWGVALVDRRKTVLLFMHWNSWFTGDSSLRRLREFCSEFSISITSHEVKRKKASQISDPMAEPAKSRKYAQFSTYRTPWFLLGLPAVWTPGLAIAIGVYHPSWLVGPGLIIPAAVLLASACYLTQACYRKFWLNRLVTVPPVSTGTFWPEHKTRVKRGSLLRE